MFEWLFRKKGCAQDMNNKLEVIGIDHGWSMMKTISQVFVTGVKECQSRLNFVHFSRRKNVQVLLMFLCE